jgi:hypothetical protein
MKVKLFLFREFYVTGNSQGMQSILVVSSWCIESALQYAAVFTGLFPSLAGEMFPTPAYYMYSFEVSHV